MVGIAILTMIVATVAAHLGLPQEIAKVISKVMQCHKCISFWSTLIVLMYIGESPFVAVLLSVLMAYASNWFAIALVLINKIYDKIWAKVRR